MSSENDHVVVEFVRSLGSPSSSGDAGTSNPADKASPKRLLAKINAEEAILSAEGRPWYEVKASLLQESDKALIRDLSGMSDQYEILIPLPEDRAHLPPEGYHTFYLNQLEMGLSSLLALGVLLKFYQAPISFHLICNLTQIRPPAQEYDLTPFLKVACAKCFNARDLVQDDLLCHFGFSRKGVVVEGDLADRIMKSYLLEDFKKQEAEASRDFNPPPEERANPTLEEPVNHLPEESANPPPAERTKEKRRNSSSGGDKHSKKKKTSSSNFVPELDLPVVNSASDKAITEALASNFLQALVWGGKLSRRVSKARETARSSRRSLDEFMVEHNKLMKEIEDVRGASDAEKKSLESLATLDVPMVVDLIGIYVLKGPYCTLTTTNWFLQALSVIPRGSWGDVARRFTMIRWEIYRRLPLKFQIPCESGRSQVPRRQQGKALKHPMFVLLHYICYVLNVFGANFETSAAPRGTGSGSAIASTVRAHGGTVAARSYSADGWPPCAIVAHGGARSARRWPPPYATIARGGARSVRQCAARCAGGGRRRAAAVRQTEAVLRNCF
ncbi:hemK methyltransferase family member 1-like [Dorcoceras hygrometricum]|uniref:HemK methyltransferase family member 1-like n=1 Tax=Dorcoceras hygrometricum TaxID=472368 RepID=A0A2Z7ANP3_9LAMI|nr:hemK methyltransferase family member 1-like [Dorcoceras hygrometricum]